MVSSRFSGKHSIKRPAVCHKELYDLPAVYATDLPTQLSAMAIWRDTAIPIDLAETFALYYNPVGREWVGSSGDTGYNLAVRIEVMPAHDTYDFFLELRTGTAVLDDDSWHDEIVAPPRPFNSGLLFHTYAWPADYNELRVLN